MTPSVLRIATRKSPLALWQTEHVAALLRARFPELAIELLPLSTRGDEILHQPLAAIGGKGLFLKELERAMEEGQADLAVHSLKDVPVELATGFSLPAVLPRADAADAMLSLHHSSLQALPQGARVGTSSLRRQALLRALRPDLELIDLRGNVGTRIDKLKAGHYQAILLAYAGLERLGMTQYIRQRLGPADWLPAPGQAAIVIEARADQPGILRYLTALDHPATRQAVEAERAMNHALGGSCSVPVGAWCTQSDHGLHLRGLVGDVNHGRLLKAEAWHADPQILGRQVAEQLLAQGAGPLLEH